MTNITDRIYEMLVNNCILNEAAVKELSEYTKSNKLNSIKRQKTLFETLNKANINSLIKINWINWFLHYFDKSLAILVEDTIFRDEDFKTIRTETTIPKVIYKDNFDLFSFLQKGLNDGFKVCVLERESSIVDLFRNVNELGQEINYLNKTIKITLSYIFSEVLNSNFKIESISIEDFMFDLDKIEPYFIEYIENIIFLLKSKKFQLAFKESVIFLESYLRNKAKENNLITKEVKKKKLKEEIASGKKMLNWLIENGHINENKKTNIEEKYLKESTKNNQKLSINSILLNDLLNESKHVGILSVEESSLLKFWLLSDNNEGFNFRNDFFHGFKNFSSYDDGFTDNLFLLAIIYILNTIYKISLKEEGKELLVYSRNEKDIFEVKTKVEDIE